MPETGSLTDYLTLIIDGLRFNLEIASAAFLLGLMVAVALFVLHAVLTHACRLVEAYTRVVRGIPPLVLLAVVFWLVLPLLGLPRDPLLASIIAFTIRSSAFSFQILKAIELEKEQIEAALALGMSKWQAATLIVLPQSLRAATPALTNEFSSLLKESTQSLALGVTDALARARYVSIATGYSLVSITVAGFLIYLVSLAAVRASRVIYARVALPGTLAFGMVELWR